MEGRIDGDLVVHATDFASSAEITGPLEIHTRGLTLSGRVVGSTQVNMIDGDFYGAFSSLTLRGNDVEFHRDANASEQLEVSARDVSLAGNVGATLKASVRSIRVTGVVSDVADFNAHPGGRAPDP